MADTTSGSEPALAREVFHRLTSRLATLDLDPPTLEILIAVLNADLDLRDDPATSVSSLPAGTAGP